MAAGSASTACPPFQATLTLPDSRAHPGTATRRVWPAAVSGSPSASSRSSASPIWPRPDRISPTSARRARTAVPVRRDVAAGRVHQKRAAASTARGSGCGPSAPGPCSSPWSSKCRQARRSLLPAARFFPAPDPARRPAAQAKAGAGPTSSNVAFVAGASVRQHPPSGLRQPRIGRDNTRAYHRRQPIPAGIDRQSRRARSRPARAAEIATASARSMSRCARLALQQQRVRHPHKMKKSARHFPCGVSSAAHTARARRPPAPRRSTPARSGTPRGHPRSRASTANVPAMSAAPRHAPEVGHSRGAGKPAPDARLYAYPVHHLLPHRRRRHFLRHSGASAAGLPQRTLHHRLRHGGGGGFYPLSGAWNG